MHGRLEARHALALGGEARHQISAPPPNEKNDRKKLDAAKGDGQAEHDLDEPAEAARRIAEGERQAGDDDDDYREDLRDRPFDRLQDLVERLLPGHVRAGGICRGGGKKPRAQMKAAIEKRSRTNAIGRYG